MGANIPFKAGGPKDKPETMKPLPHSEIEWDVTPLSSGRKLGPKGEIQDFSNPLSGSGPKQPDTG